MKRSLIFSILMMMSTYASASANSVVCHLPNENALVVDYQPNNPVCETSTCDGEVRIEGPQFEAIDKASARIGVRHKGPVSFGMIALSKLNIASADGIIRITRLSTGNYKLQNRSQLRGLPAGTLEVYCEDLSPVFKPGVSGGN